MFSNSIKKLINKLKNSSANKEVSKAENSEEKNYNSETKQKDEKIFQDVYNLIDNFMKTTPTPLFNNIEIETVNRWNMLFLSSQQKSGPQRI